MAVVELEYLSSQQVGKQLGISAARVRAYRREGRLSAVHTPLGNLHPLGAVLALAQERDRVRAVRQEGRVKVVGPDNTGRGPDSAPIVDPRAAVALDWLAQQAAPPLSETPQSVAPEAEEAPLGGVTHTDLMRVLRASRGSES